MQPVYASIIDDITGPGMRGFPSSYCTALHWNGLLARDFMSSEFNEVLDCGKLARWFYLFLP
jgi:hypothetical protein